MKKCRNCGSPVVKKPQSGKNGEGNTRITTIIGKKRDKNTRKTKI